LSNKKELNSKQKIKDEKLRCAKTCFVNESRCHSKGNTQEKKHSVVMEMQNKINVTN